MDELAKQIAELNETLKAMRLLIERAGGLHIYLHQVPTIGATATMPTQPIQVYPSHWPISA